MRRAHLVGSVPLASARAAMTAVARSLGPMLDRIPDGETGDRLRWVRWQEDRIARCPALTPSEQGDAYGRPARFKLRPEADPKDLVFETLGYAEVARESFAIFQGLRGEGIIPVDTKFQISLPTPLGVTAAFFHVPTQEIAEDAIQEAMLNDLRRIAAENHQAKLAIQWDVAIEFAILKAGMPVWFDEAERNIARRLAALGNAVPAAVDLGFHLCFGDLGHRHFVEPESLAPMVAIANAVSARVKRPITWFHMPVPRDRDDDAYFAPLLNYRSEADLYLGLLHLTDGMEGAARRVATARKFRAAFGIATECGFGRRPPESIPALLQLHRDACSRF